MQEPSLTIGRLARAASVNIETVRYYQARKLLPVPSRRGGAFRYYPVELIERIRFIKRAQGLGFSLQEIAELLRLDAGKDRASIRKLAAARLDQIQLKIDDLARMRAALAALLEACHRTGVEDPCPIIETLVPRRTVTPQ